MALINCPECNKEVSNSAEKCPHCGYDLKKHVKAKADAKGCGPAMIVIAVFVALIAYCTSGPEDDATKTVEDLESNAFYTSHDFLKQRLKSPASAEFPNYYENKESVSSDVTGKIFSIRSYVDSQNSFGANIRTNYTCTLRYDDTSDMFYLEEINLLE